MMEAKYLEKIVEKTAFNLKQVTNIFQLHTEGSTIPFIARYRKEATGNMDEVQINQVIEENARSIDKLDLLAYPNPSHQSFSIKVNTNDASTKILMQVFDQQGRLLEKKESLFPGQIITIGKTFRPGVYNVRIVQGKEHREIKLVKLGE